jgi:glycine/D-amino acid oxidase-like deaminating enzyme
MKTLAADVAIIGAGIVGLSCAYYLAQSRRSPKVIVIDPLAPMSLTSAVSGENYRNWWPHQVMTAFTDYSIDLMERIARDSDNRMHMTRRGYALATRQAHPDGLLRQLHDGYGADGARKIRIHGKGSSARYRPALSADWQTAPDGVDVIQDRAAIDAHFPTFARDIATILHIRRAGDVSGHQMGSLMLRTLREQGGLVVPGRVVEVVRDTRFALTIRGQDAVFSVTANVLVNAAGPNVGQVAGLLGESLPVSTVFQQKIAFEDTRAAIDRRMPFSIDLDAQTIDWTDQERALLADDPDTTWLTRPMPGSIHCRPDGGEHGAWIKLGWAFNTTPSEPGDDLPYLQSFPEIVLRGASRLNPGLKAYYGYLPSRLSHYGGYYTMTRENWPLIGPMQTPGAFVAGALSGFDTMASCATGALIARWVCGETLPDFALALSRERYGDDALMKTLRESGNTGVL